MVDDVVFYTSLLICISLGSYYKKIKAPDLKRSYGAGLGLLVTCLICGHEMYHSMFMVWGNVIIIKCCDKRYVHQVSMAYTWTYLLYLHTNLTCTVYVCWLHQTMALRLVGLAFEVNSEQGPVQGPIPGTSQQPSTSHTSAVKLTTSVSKQSEDNGKPVEPSAVDIISYSYFFIGLHKGPYYRWKIFNDHFNSKFGTLGDCRLITEQKLKKAVACALGCLILNTRYSKTVYEEDEFYINYGSDYRFLYNMPQLLTYFLYTQMIMMFCTSVYTEAGFGVYPAVCEPIPGHGPTSRLSLLKLASLKEDVALEQEYNFVMLKCFENNRLLLGPKMKDSLKGWDMPTRYWFWANIYKKLLNANKEVRSASSFFAWSIWYGPTLQQMIVAATLWVYIHLEDEYSSIYNTSGQMKWSWSIGFSIMRAFCFIYLTPCFVLTNTQTVLRYYHSIFWLYHFLLGILIVGAIVAQKSKL